MNDTEIRDTFTGGPGPVPAEPGAGGCCGSPSRPTPAFPEPAAGPCCGTRAEATAEGACCGSAAKTDAVAAGQGCCG